MKIYYLCGVASALLLALPLHSATELGKLPLTTPMDTSAEVTQKIKDSSLTINGRDIDNKLILSDKFVNDIDEMYYISNGSYGFTKLSDDPIFFNEVNNARTYVKPLYYYETNERIQYIPGGDCFVSVTTNNTANVYRIYNNYFQYAFVVSKISTNKNNTPIKYLTIDDSTVKLNNVLFNRNDLNIDGIDVCTSNDIENVYTVKGFSDMIYTKTSDSVVRKYLNSAYSLYIKPIYYYSTGERVKYGAGTNSYMMVPHPDGLTQYHIIWVEGDNYYNYRDYGTPIKVNIPLAIKSISIDTNRIYSTVYNSYRLATNSTYIAIGKNANQDTRTFINYTIAIGNSSKAGTRYSVSIGSRSVSSNDAVAVGAYAKAFTTNSVALGYQSAASNAFSVAIGGTAISVEDHTTAIGAQSIANHTNATSVGSQVTSHGEGTFNIYPDTMDKVYLKDNKLSDLVNTAITNQIANVVPSMIPPEKPEPTSLLTNVPYIRIGKNVKSLGGYGVVIGNNAYSRGRGSIVIGNNATSCVPNIRIGGIAIGQGAMASNNYATAIGYGALASDTNSTVIAVGTNTVNSHGINTFTVGLTDNDPLNYFYLGSSSLKSLLTNYDNSKVTAASIGALPDHGHAKLIVNDNYYQNEDSPQLSIAEENTERGVHLYSAESYDKGAMVKIDGSATTGGRLIIEPAIGENSNNRIILDGKAVQRDDAWAYSSRISIGNSLSLNGESMILNNGDISYEPAELTLSGIKVRESLTNLNNSAITKIANQSVTGGNVNLGEGLEFIGNNPLSQFDHKYYITYDTEGSRNYTAFTKASDEYNSSGDGYPLYNEDGSRLTDSGGYYVNRYDNNSICYIRPDSLQTITGNLATFTELPFFKQSNAISVSTNIAFKSDVEAVKTHLEQVISTDFPVFSNEYGRVTTSLTEAEPTLKISGSTSSDSIELSPSDHSNGSTITLNSRNGGSKINVNAGTYQSASIRVGASTYESSSAAAITVESAISDQSIYMLGGKHGSDDNTVIPAEITIGDCQVRKSIDKLTNDVTQVANSLTNSQCVVIGQGAKINIDDDYSAIAIGKAARVIGNTRDSSIAIGHGSLCQSISSLNSNIAIGDGAAASNYNSVAIGYGATASHANSISIGANTKSHGTSSFNISLQQPGNTGLHSVYIDDDNLVTLFDKRMHAINEVWLLEDPDGNTRLLTANYNTIYQEYDSNDSSGSRFNVIEFLDGYSDGYKFTWNSFTGGMSLKIANSSNELTTSIAPTSTVITFTDSNNRTYKVTRKKSYEQQTYFDDKINSLITKIQQMETTISNLTQQVNALQNP